MKILLINQAFYPDVVATAQVLTDFAVYLVQEGHDVTVLAGRRGYVPPHPLYEAQERYRQIRVIRVCSFIFGRRNRVTRVLDALILNAAFAITLFRLPRFDRVVAMTTPPLVAWAALVFCKWRKIRFIYWVMDINPDQAIKAGWIKEDSIEARFLNRTLKFVLRHSDKVVVLDHFMKETVLEKGTVPEKISVIPPWFPESDLEAVSDEPNPFREEHQLNGKFTVMYSGNHSVCHPLDTLLSAALFFKDDPSVIFLFIGGGKRVNDVIRFRKKHKLSNIVHLPYQDRLTLRYSLSAANLHVVVMGNPYVGIVHPSKIYGILSVGKPFVFIGPEESHIGEMICRFGIGETVAHGDHRGLVQLINKTRQLSTEQMRLISEKTVALKNEQFQQKKQCVHLAEIVYGESS